MKARLSSYKVACSALVLVCPALLGCRYGGGSSQSVFEAARPPGAAAAVFDAAGAWSGVYLHGGNRVRVDLDLDAGSAEGTEAARQTFTGRASFSALHEHGQRVSAACDLHYEESSQTFRLQTDAEGLSRDILPFRDVQGLVDVQGHRMAGLLGTDRHWPVALKHCFFLVRRDRFGPIQEVYERFAGVGPRVLREPAAMARRKGGSIAEWLWVAPSADTVRSWAEPLFREYAEAWVEPRGLEERAINLFAPAHFRASFGAPFDQLSDGELDGFYAFLLREMAWSDHPNDKAISQLSSLFRRSNTALSGGLTLQGTAARDVVEAWMREQARRLRDLDAAAAIPVVAALDRTVRRREQELLYPSERERLPEALAEARRRTIYPKLRQALASLIAEPSSAGKLRALHRWPASTGLQTLPAAQRAELSSQAEAAAAETLTARIEVLRERLAALGTGLDAVRSGNAWYRAFEQELEPFRMDPRCQEVVTAFAARRPADLGAAQPAMLEWVEAASSEELSSLAGTWFVVPGDADSPVAMAVARAVADRRMRAEAAITSAVERANWRHEPIPTPRSVTSTFATTRPSRSSR